MEKAHTKQLANDGFVLLKQYRDEVHLKMLQDEAEQLIERHYTPDNLAQHSVYPSDSTDTRISHALMIAQHASELPSVSHRGCTSIDQLLQDHNQMLAQITGQSVAATSRCMLNYQNYFAGSKPVGEHFDGEYIRTQRAADGIEFKLLEGILPRFVAVLVLANENQGKGTELVDSQSQQVHRPTMDPGDLLVFDNIRLRHRVPTMAKPRATLGLRNFDHMALHFAADPSGFLADDYTAIAEGWVSADVDCHQRFIDFMANDWPALKSNYAHYF